MSLCKGSSIPLGMSQLISPLTQMHPGPHMDFDQLQGTMTPTPFLNSCHFSAPIKRLCEDTRTQVAGFGIMEYLAWLQRSC